MYLGIQHREILTAIENMRKICDVDFYILSAGFGLINEDQVIPAYECSFSKMKDQKIIERSKKLKIVGDFQKIIKKEYNLIYLALGKKYLTALDGGENKISTNTIAFLKIMNPFIINIGDTNKKMQSLKRKGYVVHGTIGFKGDFLRIFSETLFSSKKDLAKISSIISNKHKLQQFIQKIFHTFPSHYSDKKKI